MLKRGVSIFRSVGKKEKNRSVSFFYLMNGFSLLEVLLATVIISIISAIAIPAYNKAKEHGLGKEAIANLQLIYASEQAYKMDHGNYVVCSCLTTAGCNAAGGCNTLLKLNLQTGNWRYVVSSGPWRAGADRQGAGGYLDCEYRVLLGNALSSTNPFVQAGTCP